MVLQVPTSLAPGFRFHPTDEELVRYYLRRKVCGKPFRLDAISEIDVYKAEPWDLPGNSKLKSRDLEWYFFCTQDKKYGNGSRSNRATVKGYWKTTGKDRAVHHGSQVVGMKKTLVYHFGRAPKGERTNWVMHEYRLVDVDLAKAGIVQDAFVLCRVFQKSGLGPKNGEQYGAPFVEEEWVEDELDIVQKVEAADEVEVGENAYSDENDLMQANDDMANGAKQRMGCNQQDQNRDKAPLLLEYSYEPQRIRFLCKRERCDDMEPLFLGQTKRSKQDDPNSSHANNGSEDSSTTSQDPAASKMMTKKVSSSALMEFPLAESVKPKGIQIQPSNQPTFDSSNLETSVPPGYLKFINNLENEILDVSMERETLKIEVMRAQAIINVLHSRNDLLSKENEDLRRLIRGGS